jgi:hypothetical protein
LDRRVAPELYRKCRRDFILRGVCNLAECAMKNVRTFLCCSTAGFLMRVYRSASLSAD